MQRQTAAARQKLDAARAAAATFVGLMDFAVDEAGGRDQVAIVGRSAEVLPRAQR